MKSLNTYQDPSGNRYELDEDEERQVLSDVKDLTRVSYYGDADGNTYGLTDDEAKTVADDGVNLTPIRRFRREDGTGMGVLMTPTNMATLARDMRSSPSFQADRDAQAERTRQLQQSPALEGTLEAASVVPAEMAKGGARAAKNIVGAFAHAGSGLLRLLGTGMAGRATAWGNALYDASNEFDQWYDGLGADKYDAEGNLVKEGALESEWGGGWGTKLGDKASHAAGGIMTFMVPGALPVLTATAANDSLVRNYDAAKSSGASTGQALRYGLTGALIDGIGTYAMGKLPVGRLLKKFGVGNEMGSLAESLDNVYHGGTPNGTAEMLQGMRASLTKKALADHLRSASESGGIMGVQTFLSTLNTMAANGAGTNDYVGEDGTHMSGGEATRKAATAGLESAAEGAALGLVMGGVHMVGGGKAETLLKDNLRKVRKSERYRSATPEEQMNAAYDMLNMQALEGALGVRTSKLEDWYRVASENALNTPEGREMLWKASNGGMERLVDKVVRGEDPTAEDADAAFLAPGLKPTEYVRIAHEYLRDSEAYQAEYERARSGDVARANGEDAAHAQRQDYLADAFHNGAVEINQRNDALDHQHWISCLRRNNGDVHEADILFREERETGVPFFDTDGKVLQQARQTEFDFGDTPQTEPTAPRRLTDTTRETQTTAPSDAVPPRETPPVETTADTQGRITDATPVETPIDATPVAPHTETRTETRNADGNPIEAVASPNAPDAVRTEGEGRPITEDATPQSREGIRATEPTDATPTDAAPTEGATPTADAAPTADVTPTKVPEDYAVRLNQMARADRTMIRLDKLNQNAETDAERATIREKFVARLDVLRKRLDKQIAREAKQAPAAPQSADAAPIMQSPAEPTAPQMTLHEAMQIARSVASEPRAKLESMRGMWARSTDARSVKMVEAIDTILAHRFGKESAIPEWVRKLTPEKRAEYDRLANNSDKESLEALSRLKLDNDKDTRKRPPSVRDSVRDVADELPEERLARDAADRQTLGADGDTPIGELAKKRSRWLLLGAHPEYRRKIDAADRVIEREAQEIWRTLGATDKTAADVGEKAIRKVFRNLLPNLEIVVEKEDLPTAHAEYDRTNGVVRISPSAPLREVAHDVGAHVLRHYAETHPESGLLEVMRQWGKDAPDEVRAWVDRNYKGELDRAVAEGRMTREKADDILNDEYGARLFANRYGGMFFEHLVRTNGGTVAERMMRTVRNAMADLATGIGMNRVDIAKALEGRTPNEAMDVLAHEIIRKGRALDGKMAYGEDVRRSTREELDRDHPGWDKLNENGGHPTQRSATTATYNKVGMWIRNETKGRNPSDVRVLDASSGLGIGTQKLREWGMTVEDSEPFADKVKRANNMPTYDDIAKAENESYDYVVSNAVLNVVPDDIRNNLLIQMGDKVKVGGKMFVSVRGKSAVESSKKGVRLEDGEVLNEGANGGYQKGYTQSEFESYVRDTLGDGWDVVRAPKGIGDSAIVATKLRPDTGGDTTRASKRTVGKDIGGRVYAHKDYAGDIVPEDVWDRVMKTARGMGIRFNTFVYPKDGSFVRLDEAPDFDTAREPHPGRMWTFKPDGTFVKESSSNQIWHHKEEWVKPNYTGFDVAKSKAWSERWRPMMNKADSRRIGNRAYWEKRLDELGLPRDTEGGDDVRSSRRGVSYKGTKSEDAKDIMDVIGRLVPHATRFVDGMAGGGSMLEEAMRSGRYTDGVAGRDKDPSGISLFGDAVRGDIDKYRTMPSREAFAGMADYTPAKRLASFNGDGRSYMGDGAAEDYARRVSGLERIRDLGGDYDLKTADYRATLDELKTGDVGFFDLPYHGTDQRGYRSDARFTARDTAEFFDRAARANAPVFVTTYADAPEGWTEVWRGRENPHRTAVERMYVQDRYANADGNDFVRASRRTRYDMADDRLGTNVVELDDGRAKFGIYVNNGRVGQDFASGERFAAKILNGDKTIETRTRKAWEDMQAKGVKVGDTLAIITDGKVRGYAHLADVKAYDGADAFAGDRAAHLVDGGKYGYDAAKGKVGLVLDKPQWLDTPYDVPKATRPTGVVTAEETGNVRLSRRDTVAQGGTADDWTAEPERNADRVRRLIQDSRIVLRKELDDRYNLDKAHSVYYALDRAYGKNANETHILQTRVIEPMLKRLADNGVARGRVWNATTNPNEVGLSDYLYAMHAKERNLTTLGRSGVVDGSGMSDATADAILRAYAHLPTAKRDALARSAQDVWDMLDASLDRRVQSGRITQEYADELRNQWQHYVPLRTDIENEANDLFNASTAGFHRNEFRTALGRTTEADDPLVFSILQAKDAITGANKNEARQRLLDVVLAHPEIGMVRAQDKLTRKWAYVPRHNGRARFMDTLETFLTGNHVERRGYVDVLGDRLDVWTPDEHYNEAERNDVVFVKRNGHLYAIEMYNDAGDRIARAVTGKGMFQWNKHLEWIPRLTRWMAEMRTQYVPTFAVRNFVTDHVEALMNATGDRGMAGASKFVGGVEKTFFGSDLHRAITRYNRTGTFDTTTQDGRYFKEFCENGGKIGGANRQGYADEATEIDDLLTDLQRNKYNPSRIRTRVGRLMAGLNDHIETGTRASVYAQCRKSGMSVEDAVSYCRDLTTNFNRKGELTPLTNSLFMFSNAAIQGSARALKAMNFTNLGTGSEHAKQAIALLATLGVAQALWDHFIGSNDENKRAGTHDAAYKSEFQKANAIEFGAKGVTTHLKVRYPWVVPMYVARKITELGLGDVSVKEAVEHLGSEVLAGVLQEPFGHGGTFAQTVSPSILVPVTQLVEGKDYKGDDLYKKKFVESLPDSANGKRTTNAAYKWAAEGLNAATGGSARRKGYVDIAPETVKTVAETIGGGVMTDVGRLMTLAEKGVKTLSSGENAFEVRDVPFLSDVFRENPDVVNAYYQTLNEADANDYAYKKAKGAEKRDEVRAHRHVIGPVHDRLKQLEREIRDLSHRAQGTANDGHGGYVPINISDKGKRLAEEMMRRKMATYIRLYEKSGK